jgi:hypothetical protein
VAAQVARVESQLDFRAHTHSPSQFSKFWAIVPEAFQFNTVVEHNPLDGHPQYNFQFAGARRQWRWQVAYIALPPMSRSILDATMRRLQVDVDDPPMEHLAERAE